MPLVGMKRRQRYINLQAGSAVSIIVDGQSLLVKSDVAEAQMIVEAAEFEERRTSLEAGQCSTRKWEPIWASDS